MTQALILRLHKGCQAKFIRPMAGYSLPSATMMRIVPGTTLTGGLWTVLDGE